MRIVAALGGNALMRRGEPLTSAHQRDNVEAAAVALAPLYHAGYGLIVTHGNGPQVGLLALQAAAGPAESSTPLDILDAESEGMIGYLIEQALANLLPTGTRIATLLTQVRVDRDDPAFARPDKPIGPAYAREDAERRARDLGWSLIADGRSWRRAVPSPRPQEIMELPVIEMLVDAGVLVICAGGGGIPVVRRDDSSLIGIEAVIDKDRASALLARQLAADCLLLLTDVDAVYLDWGTPRQRAIEAAAPGALSPEDFAAGSMRPKLEAAIAFAEATGKPAMIGGLSAAAALLEGRAGTRIDSAVEGLLLRPELSP